MYMYMFVCIYVYIYVYIYTHTYVDLFVSLYVYICICLCIQMLICLYVCMSLFLYVYTFICICEHICMRICMCIYVCVCVCVCMCMCICRCICKRVYICIFGGLEVLLGLIPLQMPFWAGTLKEQAGLHWAFSRKEMDLFEAPSISGFRSSPFKNLTIARAFSGHGICAIVCEKAVEDASKSGSVPWRSQMPTHGSSHKWVAPQIDPNSEGTKIVPNLGGFKIDPN